MSPVMISLALYSCLALPLWCVQTALIVYQKAALKGSYTRYILTTWTIILSAVTIGAFLICAAYDLGRKDYAAVTLEGFFIPGYILWQARHLFDDNNWFNSQFKKLKQGFKNAWARLGRIRLAFPSPLPSPA